MLDKVLKPTSWALILGLVIVTVVPASDRPMTGLSHHFEHFIAFALVGLTFGMAYTRHLPTILLSAIIFTLALELCQIPLATRHARLADFVVDAAAACLGILAGRFCRILIETRAVPVNQSLA
jgi:VanZ family protein